MDVNSKCNSFVRSIHNNNNNNNNDNKNNNDNDKTEETVRPEEFKRMQINASEQAWKERKMHGQYIRDMDENIDKDKT